MTYADFLVLARDFATAILLGALVGIEREKRKEEEMDTGHIAGLRTFILLSLTGAAAGWLAKDLDSPWILAAALLAIGALVTAGYFATARTSQNDKGLTTEVAGVVVFLLGATVMLGYQALAIGLAVVTAAVLAYKQPLHGFVENVTPRAGERTADRRLAGRHFPLEFASPKRQDPNGRFGRAVVIHNRALSGHSIQQVA